MTTTLGCRLSVISEGLDFAQAALGALPGFIHDQLLFFSHGDINLAVEPVLPAANLAPAGAAVSALQLHVQLLALNQNPPNGPLQRVGVLFADSYAGLPGAFGIMFDRGFATADDPNSAPIFLARPRQGCAVFLRQIALARSSDQLQAEVLFTTVHELGHLFDLPHDLTSLNFMQISDPHTAFGVPAFHFTPDQQSRLEMCSQDPNVMPGSSIFEADSAANLEAPAPPRLSQDLALRLSLARDSYWRFEPIQVEIRLERAEGKAPIDIPAVIDPSHDAFRLMIENDLGERTLYRTPYRVCGGSDVVSLRADAPYRRDFPLFGQSGGYTFRRAGRHTVWAELDLGEVRIRSNKVRVHIEREVGLSALDREYKSMLTDPHVGALLFHREDPGSLAGFHKLARYIALRPEAPSAGEINYALARAALAAPEVAGTGKDRSRRLLERALAADGLGAHAHDRANALLVQLEEGSSGSARVPPG